MTQGEGHCVTSGLSVAVKDTGGSTGETLTRAMDYITALHQHSFPGFEPCTVKEKNSPAFRTYVLKHTEAIGAVTTASDYQMV